MFVFYNRVSREIWIADPSGNVRARAKAAPGARLTDEAGRFLTANGFVRTGEYLLVSTGSPLRRASIALARGRADAGSPTADTGITASGIARSLNERFGHGMFEARHGDLPQNRHVVFVSGSDPKQLQAAYTHLRGRGYRLEFTSTGRLLRVVGKTA